MNTLEAVLSVIFIALFIIEHGDSSTATDSLDQSTGQSTDQSTGQSTGQSATIPCTEPMQKRLHITERTVTHTVPNSIIIQDPRFLGLRRDRNATIQCGCLSYLPINTIITWYLGHQNGSVIRFLLEDQHITFNESSLIIKKIQKKHSGIYFCNISRHEVHRVPCGTELMVLGPVKKATVQSRSILKDAIIMVQTILIVLSISVPVLLLMEMNKKRTLKIEDHTYEGLEAYQSATYEDIQTVRVLATKTMEGEHPCLE